VSPVADWGLALRQIGDFEVCSTSLGCVSNSPRLPQPFQGAFNKAKQAANLKQDSHVYWNNAGHAALKLLRFQTAIECKRRS
jgi:hypothetical protein